MMELIKWIKTICLILILPTTVLAQTDSTRTRQLGEITIEGLKLFTLERLPSIQGTYIWAGKKSEVINVQAMDANIADKLARQIFSKVPGVFIYDMDGTGNQINISTRGLDPHRGWEFNIRKNGIITNSDMYGYPASHYSMPIEAVSQIELVRGTGSLQYGAQFGGMLNYVSKKPDTTRAVSYESIHSVGSFNTLSTYHGLSGSFGKFKYYAYYHKRGSDGYRDNSRSDSDAQSFLLTYTPMTDLEITAELARSTYTHQIPGPLTDSMFLADSRYAARARNHYSPEIYVPSLSLKWEIGAHTKLSWVMSAVLGVRNSVQFIGPANMSDDILPETLDYSPRWVDVDDYNSYTSELRVLHQYTLGDLPGAVSAGLQLMDNDQHRQQLGRGTTGTDFDISTIGPWGRDLHFKTTNLALFVENSFWLTPELVVTPGMRLETGETEMSGTINYYDPGEVPHTIEHKFPLFGINAEYTFASGASLYTGWSQAYRPVIFQDIIPATTYDISDKNIKDSDGYNLELGYRGKIEKFHWDVGAFSLRYNNRAGTLAGDATNDGNYYILRTTIGDALTNGLELFVEYSFLQTKSWAVTAFTSTALFDSKYINAQVRSGNENIDITGNRIESVPEIISRNGLTIQYEDFSLSFLYSYTGETFADPLNTVDPSPSGSVGIVPAYGLLDVNASLNIFTRLLVRFNISNVGDNQYFTKRPEFYPGPGVWPSDGRSMNCSVAFKI